MLDGYTIFLDRDGTLNEDPGSEVCLRFKIASGVATALARSRLPAPGWR